MDEAKALELYRKDAGQNYADAKFRVGVLYAEGHGGVVQSYMEAMKWCVKAAG